nr:hypothetical protein Iba_chr02bCG7750 [Ipomoea batatas]
MAPSIVQLSQSYKIVDLRYTPSANYGGREISSQFSHGCPHLVGHEGTIRVVDDGGKGPVVVQKHHNFLSLGSFYYLLEHVESGGMAYLPGALVFRERALLGRGRGRSSH